MRSHRFDHWVTLFASRTTRRSGLVLVAGGLLDTISNADNAAARKPGKRKGDKYKKPKGKKHDPKPPDQPTDWSKTCSFGACFNRWPSSSKHDLNNRTYCEFIREQCDGDDPRQFCIVNNEVADCCGSGETCCGGGRCVTFGTPEHCTGCDEPCVGPGLECCQSEFSIIHSCVDTTSSRKNCGGCGQLCIHPDTACCDGSCEDTLFNDAHCGGCNPCPPGWECCHGRCIDSKKSWCCYDHPPSIGVCPAAAPCCIRSDGNPGCCLLM